jgi:hypothetical protein
MREIEPQLRPNPWSACPCGSGRLLSNCCQRLDGTIYKEHSSIHPPGETTGFSHAHCYLNFTNNCDDKITGEHFASQGILREIGASKINVQTAPWLQPGKTKVVGIRSLVAKILCRRHNSAFSAVDATATRFFKLLNEINIDFARRTLPGRVRFYLVSGEDLEMWAFKTLLGVLYSQSQDSPLAEYEVDNAIVTAMVRTGHLPSGCGLYLNGTAGVNRDHTSHELTIRPINHNKEKRLIGLELIMAGMPFHFFLDPYGVNFEYERVHKLYRPSPLIFDNGKESHNVFLSWPFNPAQDGVIFTVNAVLKAGG